METYIQQLEVEKARLEKEVSDLEVQCQMVEKKAVERRQAEEKVSSFYLQPDRITPIFYPNLP